MANTNRTLHKAKAAKNDEFYTQLSDIENELKHYRAHFEGKTVLCNCDDPRVSNFFKYFALNFEILGLKRLFCTCYKNQEPDLFSQHDSENAVYIVYDGDKNGNKVPDPSEMEVLPLQGDGDFRSAECIELLKKADVVCTNPPFSLFGDYINQLVKYNKKFLILGRMSALHKVDIFPLIMKGQVWMGYGFNMSMVYKAPYENIEEANKKYVRSKGYDPEDNYIKVPAICWFTNLDHQKRHDKLILYRTYNPQDFPKYDNYDAIEVGRVAEIPFDYDGVMGVPDTFLGSFNPEQFEILGASQRGCHDLVPDTKKYNDYWEVKQDGTKTGSSGNKTNENANLERNDGKHNYFINKDGHIVQSAYSRIFIRRK